jgi:replicative DNA helicase
VAIFSLEMSSEQIVLRMLCSEARVNLKDLRGGRLFEQDWGRLSMAASSLTDAPVFIDDSSAINALEIKAKTRRLKVEHNVGMVIVDYLQMMEGAGRAAENRQQEIAQISRNMKALAKELEIPVIVASQLNRASEREGREDKKPQLSHLRESGAIEQDADLVLMLYRPFYYDHKPEGRTKTELMIAKQRNGPVGSVDIAFIEEYARFDDLAPGMDEPPPPEESQEEV